jgi:protein TonB
VPDCTEPIEKPKVESLPQAAYTERAREGSVQGKVRVEIRVDERGAVTSVSLLSGLGFGLDEAALDAARKAKFKPATRCGKPVASPFVVSMRFSL